MLGAVQRWGVEHGEATPGSSILAFCIRVGQARQTNISPDKHIILNTLILVAALRIRPWNRRLVLICLDLRFRRWFPTAGFTVCWWNQGTKECQRTTAGGFHVYQHASEPRREQKSLAVRMRFLSYCPSQFLDPVPGPSSWLPSSCSSYWNTAPPQLPLHFTIGFGFGSGTLATHV